MSGRSSRAGPRSLALGLGLLAALTVGVEGMQQRTVLRAVLVHGEALEGPMLFHEPESVATCLWIATYNLYTTGDRTPRSPEAPGIILSFLTDAEWEGLVEKSSTAEGFSADIARFHTRLLLTPLGGPPPQTLSRKAPGIGPFERRRYLHPLGERILARHGIPTRLDSAGQTSASQPASAEDPGPRGQLGECLELTGAR